MKVRTLLLGKDALVELADLSVLGRRALVAEVAHARHDVGSDLHRRLGDVLVEGGSGLRRGSLRLVRVGEVRRLLEGVAVDAHLTGVVVRREVGRHESRIDGDLVEVGGAEPVDLSVAVEPVAVRKESVGRGLDAGNCGESQVQREETRGREGEDVGGVEGRTVRALITVEMRKSDQMLDDGVG